jgi:hypothetical protein
VIVSLFQEAGQKLPGNYRPITLLPVMDKLYMSVLAARLQKHVSLHDHQFAFRSSRESVDAIFTVAEIVRLRAEQGKPTYAFRTWQKRMTRCGLPGLLYKLRQRVTGGCGM